MSSFIGQQTTGDLDLVVDEELDALIRTALLEDLRYGPDVTTLATVPADTVADAKIVARQAGVVAGLPVVRAVFDQVIGAGNYVVTEQLADGARVEPGSVALAVRAPATSLLTAERTALNLLCHLSGIATATAAWVEAVDGTKARIRDSRKTLPGLRALQKYAVRAGGGVNHRMGLGDAALIKDNHVVAAGGVGKALAAVRAAAPEVPVEVEVDSLEQLDEVLALAPQLVLLDNFEPWATQMAVQRRDAASPDTLLESSGGLSLDVALDYARTGVDFLAVGALTHSVTVLDFGLDM
ncbi:carboxylating nicotinate-nucleotide diphosphorylase [Gordonia sp. (in: high G+C Gram-positive bacteria)]|uniref:carboxylating nicotinate-nucleotide diphosphorylase n=1 Tax=Gordonia sp. (in: high G+C Gram-positive bacteria) TaxID=84139 RepID=UPI001695B1F0|nr:carboxylating nicotinate-nucleotide diphosphorylase [Gordonia sp. (in: high G+C Gram-positive bacteria)]NLG46583.1 carboxylating nicotinate-nucleotide diphosphorylase [Gordonia sp. (in: high G+C Gram-positive bacteria)]